MKLSKQENKYRYKLFYENHYNKFMQQDMDYYIQHQNVTYKAVYLRESLPYMFMIYPTKAAVKRTSKALKKLGISMKDNQGNFRDSGDILSDIADKWNKLGGVDDC